MPHSLATVELRFDAPRPLTRRPRRWRLGGGVAAWTAAAALAASEAHWAWWQAAQLGDIRFALTLLLLMGGALLFKALIDDHFRLHAAALHGQGLVLHWSHEPRGFGERVHGRTVLAWTEVEGGEWLENEHGVDQRQWLHLDLARPLAGGRRRVRVRLCEQRQLTHCLAVAQCLPRRIARPAWLQQRQRQARDAGKHGRAEPRAQPDDTRMHELPLG